MAKSLVAFQGERGSFSEEAAYKLLGRGIRVQPCETFTAIFESVSRGGANYCLVPIENTLAGSVYENFDLLLANNLHIMAEVSLRIVHNLIALPGTTRKAAASPRTVPRAPPRARRPPYTSSPRRSPAASPRKSTTPAFWQRIWKITAKTTRASFCFPRPHASAARPTKSPSCFPRATCRAPSTSA